MKVQFYKPTSEILKKYIEGFYFVTPEKIHQPLTYQTFPNNFCIAAVYRSTHLILEENKIIVSAADTKNIESSLVSRYVRPIEIIQNDITDEITIYFKPLGLNHFISDIKPCYTEDIIHFNPFSDYKQKMSEVFNISDRDEQIRNLEAYWLSKLIVRDFVLLESIVADMQEGCKINEVAEKYSISRQRLNRMFTREIGKTPSEFKKIHRFRNSISEKQKTNNLTELSYLVQFYDQSHFIKEFKNFTNLSPLSFFNKVDTQKENVWLEL